MISIIISINLIFLSLITNIDVVVTEFHQLISKKDETTFIEKYKTENNPSIIAYVICLEIKQASYKINPIQKLSIFNKNKEKLDSLIILNKNNIHLRYARLMIQEKSPAFLGYKEHIKSDKLFIKNKLQDSKYKTLKQYITKTLSL
jgi:hypothetical protein